MVLKSGRIGPKVKRFSFKSHILVSLNVLTDKGPI